MANCHCHLCCDNRYNRFASSFGRFWHIKKPKCSWFNVNWCFASSNANISAKTGINSESNAGVITSIDVFADANTGHIDADANTGHIDADANAHTALRA
jgi:hypothetical protein